MKNRTLGDFVKNLVAGLHSQKVTIPFENEILWHELFYELKKDRKQKKQFAFLENLHFDWDGPYPKSSELTNFLHALHWNACVSAHNPYFDKITLSKEIAKLWMERFQKLDLEEKKNLNEVVKKAKKKFSSVPAGR